MCYEELRENYSKHKIYVRFGLIEFNEGKSSGKQIDVNICNAT